MIVGNLDLKNSDIEIAIVHDKNDLIYIIHDTPFTPPISWVEYDIHSGQIHFICEEGNIGDYGIPVGEEFKKLIVAMSEMPIALLNEGKLISGDNYPLIIHH